MRRRAARFQVPVRSDQSVRHNVRFFILLGLLAAGGPAAMDMYIPALPTVATDLGASTSAAQLTVGLYLVGLAAGQLVFGQWSDVAGRRRPLLIGLGMFVLEPFIPSHGLLTIGGIIAVVLGGSVLYDQPGQLDQDVFGLTASARYYSRLTIIYGTAPLVAPLIGADPPVHLVARDLPRDQRLRCGALRRGRGVVPGDPSGGVADGGDARTTGGRSGTAPPALLGYADDRPDDGARGVCRDSDVRRQDRYGGSPQLFPGCSA